jgi:phosphate transport system substrate-binding protein
MKGKILKAMAVVGIVIAVVGCGAKPTPTPEPPVRSAQVVLKISGSGSVVPILAAIQPAFEADTPGYDLEVLPGSGTGGGVKGAVQGVLDVAAMARPPKDEEAAQGIQYVGFGQSGVAVYTHPDVGITDLTTAQVKAVLSGEVENWSQVGGPDMPIILCVRDEGDSSTKALRQAFFGDAPFPETAEVLTSQGDMQAAVAGSPGSVGFGSWPSALASGADVRAIVLDGVTPGDSAYSMVSPIGIGYLTDRKADVQPLVDWLLSERGQAALQEFGVITTQ